MYDFLAYRRFLGMVGSSEWGLQKGMHHPHDLTGCKPSMLWPKRSHQAHQERGGIWAWAQGHIPLHLACSLVHLHLRAHWEALKGVEMATNGLGGMWAWAVAHYLGHRCLQVLMEIAASKGGRERPSLSPGPASHSLTWPPSWSILLLLPDRRSTPKTRSECWKASRTDLRFRDCRIGPHT